MSQGAPDLRPVPLESVEVAEVRALPPAITQPRPANAVTVAATSFVVGVATAAVVRRRSARKLARRRGKGGRLIDALPVVGSRSFLVDVHLLGRE
jgi:hypothetical protein